MRVTIVGAGNVGTATGCALEIIGKHDVIYYDVREEALDGKKKTTMSQEEAVSHGEVIIVCVPTESAPDYRCDLRIFESVIDWIGDEIAKLEGSQIRRVIVQRSTCPPGTAQRMIDLLTEKGLSDVSDFTYVVNPSFLCIGVALQDEVKQRKCVIGVGSCEDGGQMIGLWNWVQPDVMTHKEAEWAKYANNVFHATVLSLWNEMYMADPYIDWDKIALVTTKERGLESVYRVFGQAYGGPCLPKDTLALKLHMEDLGIELPVLNGVIEVNERIEELYGVRGEHGPELVKGKDYDGWS